MTVYELHRQQVFRLPVEETFRFFEEPANLARITPPWLHFLIRSESVVMAEGAEIEYTIRYLGLPLKWRTLITGYDPPHLFVDEQIEGPYRLWRHRHVFEPHEDGALVTDHVLYALPLGPLGRLAHAAIVRRQLEQIFSYRRAALAEILQGRLPENEQPAVKLGSAWRGRSTDPPET